MSDMKEQLSTVQEDELERFRGNWHVAECQLETIRQQVRELADRIEGGAEPVLEDTECIVDELRAILDPPDGEGS